ncbi:glycerate kinase [Psychrobacter sp. DAB_AL62B]|uniref:glycerate kinase n=1 Tax=Psychrobacter sp. DAB_AL62B TaxID=1028420 RepID=UPI0023811444|nr:glycerate kinase [Psychrobacter sp. DAB_AL62B]MDE4453673.1 glycerate kinase [Psychrobacter sp. DAB_AL62B]
MKILIAPDSFKESLEALDVCHAIQAGFSQVFPDADYKLLPMADGGEGTSAVLSYVLGGRWKEVRVHDPLMRPISAKYLLLPDETAVIEIAQACGLHLLTVAERNPVIASSYGVGELIADALEEGVKRIIIGLGGSATNDAGLGMLMALGMTFHDSDVNKLSQGGGELANLQRLDATSFHVSVLETVFEVACDVTNPLCGELGASAIFGPQKGASSQQINDLDKALSHFASVCEQHGYQNYQEIAGAGAAGGLGYALMTFCNAQLKSGFDTVAKVANLSQHIANADLVITGEGKLDAQTAMGKVAGGISQLAKASHTPVIAICGSVDGLKPAQTSQFDVIMPSIQKIDTIDNVFKNAYRNIETTAANIAAAIRLGQSMR